MGSRHANFILFLCVFLLSPRLAPAQELSLLLGRTEAPHAVEASTAWQVDFRYDPVRYLGWSVSYVNEGHVTGHKRDGVATQVWGRVPLYAGRLVLSLGAGPYRFFDTVVLPGGGFEDLHGWAAIYSLSAAWHTASPWVVRLTANHVKGSADLDTNSFVVGVGYRLRMEKGPEPAGLPGREDETIPLKTGDEVMPFAGQTIVNSPQDQKGIASGIEFRKGIADHLDWTLTWLNEGDPRVLRRNGLGSQLWLVDSYFGNRFAIGGGVGGYYFVDRKRPPEPGKEGTRDLAYLISATASYRFARHWFARLTWNRVLVDYNRDTDVFVVGAGYRLRD